MRQKISNPSRLVQEHWSFGRRGVGAPGASQRRVSGPFNLVIGENNIGKTNLLNALALIFSPDITFSQRRSLEVDDIE